MIRDLIEQEEGTTLVNAVGFTDKPKTLYQIEQEELEELEAQCFEDEHCFDHLI